MTTTKQKIKPSSTNNSNVVNDESARDIIYNAVQSMPGAKRYAAGSIFVCCPFHDEDGPSCGVTVTNDSTVPLGVYHCFGCSAHGSWNKFARKAGLPEIKEWKFYDAEMKSAQSLISKDAQTSLLGSFSEKSKTSDLQEAIYQKIETRETIPWPSNKEWRGYSGKLLNKLGALYINDNKQDELMIALPVIVNHKVRGAIRALIVKGPKDKVSYFTSKGKWVKRYGLFPFDYVKNIIRKKDLGYVVLVEGPRDALRLISLGIPALAVLGIENVTKEKIDLLLTLFKEVECIYYMPDKDVAGNKMSKRVKELTEGLVPAQKINLPVILNKEGRAKKIDPDNCPSDYMHRVVKYLKTKHHRTAVA